MDIVIALAVGAVVGWIAGILMNTSMGLIPSIAVGIVGSWLGFWLAPKFGLSPSDGIGRWLVAIGGAALLIFILKALKLIR